MVAHKGDWNRKNDNIRDEIGDGKCEALMRGTGAELLEIHGGTPVGPKISLTHEQLYEKESRHPDCNKGD